MLYLDQSFQTCLLRFLATGPDLVDLALADSSANLDVDGRFPVLPPALDGALAGLARLRRLALNPCAVASLPAALGALEHLVTLTLLQDVAVPSRVVPMDDVVGLLAASRSLAEVWVAQPIWAQWAPAERAALPGAIKPSP